jgi:acetyltransferase-like isoleucine patch superfamily enzyme
MADSSTFGLQASDDNIIEILGERTGSLDIRGKRNRLVIGQGARFDGELQIVGDDNVIEIGAWATMRGSYFGIMASNSTITFGEGSGAVQTALHVFEPGRIMIGRNCALGVQTWISNTDMHPVYDMTSGERINPAADVIIGDHAWVGLRSIVLKGTHIEGGAIVGAGSTVSGHVSGNTAVGGAPAKVIRPNVRWEWDF